MENFIIATYRRFFSMREYSTIVFIFKTRIQFNSIDTVIAGFIFYPVFTYKSALWLGKILSISQVRAHKLPDKTYKRRLYLDKEGGNWY